MRSALARVTMRDVRRSYLFGLLAAAAVIGAVLALWPNDAALEHFTATLAELVLSDEEARAMFGDQRVLDLFLWHALEESEHKAVAFDVYRAVGGTERMRTVTMDVRGAVSAAKAGQVEFRAEKAGIVHAGIGKASFDEAKLLENARAFVDAIQRAKPAGAKGTYLKKAAVSSSMGPGVKVDVASLSAPTA